MALTVSSRPWAFSASQSGAVRLHCHTTALATGLPVDLSQTRVVSRWFVMPIALICRGLISVSSRTSSTTSMLEPNSSSGLCSTQPDWGNICRISVLVCHTTLPDPSTTIAVVPVVP